MRKPIIAGNWKMFKTRDEALQFIYAVSDKMPSNQLVDSVICAPAIVLRDLVKRQGEELRIGAQNMHFKESGAYTGEISPVMLTTTGVTYVIIKNTFKVFTIIKYKLTISVFHTSIKSTDILIFNNLIR